MSRRLSLPFVPLLGLSSLLLFAAGACSGAAQTGADSDANDADGDADDSALDGSFGDLGDSASAGGGASDSDSGGPVCETASSEAVLQPIFLAFAFDVSGSMGKLDKPFWWHDPAKKWDPVVAATTEFFQDVDSAGISASMALFPAAGGSGARCDSQTYEDPDVPMTGLPSSEFAETLASYREDDWRGGTPTLAVVEGTLAFLEPMREQNPGAKFALVLVTDGVPADCDDDSIAAVADAVAGVEGEIATYVIGVQNAEMPPAEPPWDNWGGTDCDQASDNVPCDPPATLEPLNQIAAAGGTGTAFLIDTGNPAATKAAFRAAIDSIRAQALSCNLGIPPHPVEGETFDKDKVNVSVTVDGEKDVFSYDPECASEGSWHYDDEQAPTEIVLCPSTCTDVQGTPGADLDVDFLCRVRDDVVR